MLLSIDGGALTTCGGYGNHTFTSRLIEAMEKYDKKNTHRVYTFKHSGSATKLKKNISLECMCMPQCGFVWWMGLCELVSPSDVFIATNQVIPPFVRGKKIAICHGLAYHFFPTLYPDSYQLLENQLHEMVKCADYIVVSSIKVKSEIEFIFSQTPPISVIPFGAPILPQSIIHHPLSTIHYPFILFVGMDHPIKNFALARRVFRSVQKKYPDLKLIVVGHKEKYEKDGIMSLGWVDHQALSTFYQHARCLLTTSLYESFNLPVLEALSYECPVVGLTTALVPELAPYAFVSKNQKELVDNLAHVMMKKIKGSKEVSQVFTWKKYVETLQKLF